jgi:hypothetical protein
MVLHYKPCQTHLKPFAQCIRLHARASSLNSVAKPFQVVVPADDGGNPEQKSSVPLFWGNNRTNGIPSLSGVTV